MAQQRILQCGGLVEIRRRNCHRGSRSDTLQSPLGESKFSKRVRGNDDETRTDPWQGDPMLCARGVIGIAQTKDFERTAANAAARRPESVETRGQAGHVLSYEQSPPQR